MHLKTEHLSVAVMLPLAKERQLTPFVVGFHEFLLHLLLAPLVSGFEFRPFNSSEALDVIQSV